MVIDKSHCLIFISRMFIPGANKETMQHLFQKFEKDTWESLDVNNGLKLSEYFSMDEFPTSILRIEGNRYFYAANGRFWNAFAEQNGEAGIEEHKEGFWFFEKIEESVQQLTEDFNITPQTLHIFIHWGGSGYDVKHKNIQNHYQSYVLSRESASPYQFHFYHFSRRNSPKGSISWSIYNEADPHQFLHKLKDTLVLEDPILPAGAKLPPSAQERFVQFETQIFEDENFLEEDQNKPRGFDYLVEQGAIDINGSTDIFPEV